MFVYSSQGSFRFECISKQIKRGFFVVFFVVVFCCFFVFCFFFNNGDRLLHVVRFIMKQIDNGLCRRTFQLYNLIFHISNTFLFCTIEAYISYKNKGPYLMCARMIWSSSHCTFGESVSTGCLAARGNNLLRTSTIEECITDWNYVVVLPLMLDRHFCLFWLMIGMIFYID